MAYGNSTHSSIHTPRARGRELLYSNTCSGPLGGCTAACSRHCHSSHLPFLSGLSASISDPPLPSIIPSPTPIISTPLQDYNSLPPAEQPQGIPSPVEGGGSMGGCVSLDGGPAVRGRNPNFHTRSPPPLSVPLSATVPEDDEEPVVKQVLHDTRVGRRPSNDEKAYHSPDYSPVKAKTIPTGAQPGDHGAMGGNDPKPTSPTSHQTSSPLGSTLRSASARELPGDRSGMQQPEMMMMMTWGHGMLGRRARSLRDHHPGEGPLFLQSEPEKPRKSVGPGKETLENPLVSLECFIFL